MIASTTRLSIKVVPPSRLLFFAAMGRLIAHAPARLLNATEGLFSTALGRCRRLRDLIL
jgi:hypothetical protein